MAGTKQTAYTCKDEAASEQSGAQCFQTVRGFSPKMEIPVEMKDRPTKKNKRKSSEPRKAVRREIVEQSKDGDIELDDDDYGYSFDICKSVSSASDKSLESDVMPLQVEDYRQNFPSDPIPTTSQGLGKPGRSYKSLSRARRVVANARERNRVHTISAAFEGLRKAVPSYSHNQKLSKLAILRIACSYILALARLADLDYSESQAGLSFAECVQECTLTLQAEGRSRRRKE
ncbi:neurogenic differentiation factor 1-like [Ptychodera flava]|uniref:neurogenic differentiation factor 1-like n=1 Tax=Ptychodera flava TaxID=63121 RepID=UPI00396A12D6